MRKGFSRWAFGGLTALLAALTTVDARAQPRAINAADPGDPPLGDAPPIETAPPPRPIDPTETNGDESPREPAPTATPRPARRPRGHFFSRSDDAAERVAFRARRRARRPAGAPDVLEVAGAPDAYFYRPGARRRRVFVYMHARGSDPEASCRQLRVAVAPYGWLLCPVGPVDRGNGRHEWNNDPVTAHRYAMAALAALSARFPRRVMQTGHVVLGFSEGAFVGMQLGMMEPRVFPRWVIFAGTDYYLTSDSARWAEARRWVRRVYLFTGERDNVVSQTRRAEAHLRRERVGRVQLRVMPDMGHQLPDNNVTLGRALRFVMQ